MLNAENCETSDGWLRLWKERNHKTFKTVLGESESVTPVMVDGWWEIPLPTPLPKHELKDIYTADECGLFYNVFQIKPIDLA